MRSCQTFSKNPSPAVWGPTPGSPSPASPQDGSPARTGRRGGLCPGVERGVFVTGRHSWIARVPSVRRQPCRMLEIDGKPCSRTVTHGIEIRLDSEEDTVRLDDVELERVGVLEEVLKGIARGIDNVWIEDKPAGFALHTRLATERHSRVAHVVALSEARAEVQGVTVREGKNVLKGIPRRPVPRIKRVSAITDAVIEFFTPACKTSSSRNDLGEGPVYRRGCRRSSFLPVGRSDGWCCGNALCHISIYRIRRRQCCRTLLCHRCCGASDIRSLGSRGARRTSAAGRRGAQSAPLRQRRSSGDRADDADADRVHHRALANRTCGGRRLLDGSKRPDLRRS